MDLSVLVNTNSKIKDLWDLFRVNFENNFDLKCPIYWASDEIVFSGDNHQSLIYKTSDSFREQLLSCLELIPSKYVLFISEDYLLYNKVDMDSIRKFYYFLESNETYSFVRLQKGIDTLGIKISNYDLFLLTPRVPYFYSQTAAIWRTSDLLKIFKGGSNGGIGRTDGGIQFEDSAQWVCKNLNLIGSYYYDNEPKRGDYHYDSKVFPCIHTALVSGKWNFKEYQKELLSLSNFNSIDTSIRGRFI
tara:strand:- start:7173 stop:7910 length:738 start_codon:yes stop_codon:yes gene_type:complete